ASTDRRPKSFRHRSRRAADPHARGLAHTGHLGRSAIAGSGWACDRRHATSGSSGLPGHFFFSDVNVRYNEIRGIAQYFLEGRDLSLNRTRIRDADGPVENEISVLQGESWIGPLASLFKSGKNRHIEHHTLSRECCHKLIQELEKEEVGYL